MIPNFNVNKWDREKILDCVIGEQPLSDGQLEFLNYFDKLQNEHIVLTELEKWLENEINIIENEYSQINGNYMRMQPILDTFKECLDKLQKLRKG